MNESPQTVVGEPGRASAWLSEGLESLIRQLGARPGPATESFDFDVVIVGSGYGGAVALSRLAGYADQGRPLRICMLERGQEYLPGMFPSGFADLAGHVRFDSSGSPRSRGVAKGLFDVKTGPDAHVLVASGLGGGSLINAGVMGWPVDAVFDSAAWPEEVRRDRKLLKQLATALKQELGAAPASTHWSKVEAMRRLGGAKGAATLDITVAPISGPNTEGVEMHGCIGCGDCFTGCNHRAKSSLDVTLLVAGRRKAGAKLYTGATVLRIEQLADAGWQLEVVHTEELKRRREAPLQLRSRIVVLAAGTFGSSEILWRSRDAGLSTSPMLGERFSANGDSMAEVYESGFKANAVADERVPPRDREVGPTITSMIDRRTGDPARDLVVQDITVPAAMRRAFEELSVTANSLQLLGEPDESEHSRSKPPRDPNAVDENATRHSLLVALIGHDDANGKLVMTHRGADDPTEYDGRLWVSWPKLREDPRFAERQRVLEGLANPGAGTAALGGRVLANPMWRALPEKVTGIIDAPLGPLMTVHPLGGCAMAADGSKGVVDHLGRVYSGSGKQVHTGLVVLDGAIVPTSLGINPALTIATLADRAIRELRDHVWGFAPAAAAGGDGGLAFPRPFFREVPVDIAPVARPTMVQISERLRGPLALDLGDGRKPYDVEMVLWSKPIALAGLMKCEGVRSIEIDPAESELRVFELDTPSTLGRMESDLALHRMSVAGELKLLGFADSSPFDRALRGTFAWLRNRGLRDIAQAVMDKLSNPFQAGPHASFFDQLRMLYALATRAGAKRLLEYELELKPSGAEPEDSLPALAGKLRGHKSLTYCFAGNPWTQLQQIEITQLPGWRAKSGEPAILEYDLTYSERANLSLMKLVDQQDMPTALADLGSFGMYLLRTVLHVHVWTFRQPDPSPLRKPETLPLALRGLPKPQEIWLDFAKLSDGTDVRAKLTRYRLAQSSKLPPVVLIHGYSASGTTFAHDAIPEGGLAGHLCRRERDVWVLDLRSSCGLPTASKYWTFEEVGYSDIPKAVDRVLRETGAAQVDIVAHCMGSAMLSMALLGEYPAVVPDENDPYLDERKALPSRIRKLVMSQVGPALVMAPENVFRAYLMRYLRHYLPLADYSFNTAANPSQGDAMLDRVLSSIPYPKDEFRLENPLWPPGARTPWVAVRHRMDALYGRTFKLDNMPEAVLERIDDFFGTLNLDTVAQVIHFAKGYGITDARGRGRFEDEATVKERFGFETLTLHSRENGLVSPLTAEAMVNFLSNTTRKSQVANPDKPPFSKLGHQDSLIGKTAPQVFRRISTFLE